MQVYLQLCVETKHQHWLQSASTTALIIAALLAPQGTYSIVPLGSLVLRTVGRPIAGAAGLGESATAQAWTLNGIGRAVG